MIIHHLRNATMVIESGEHYILVDPMLGAKGKGMPFSLVRQKLKLNPIVDLPQGAEQILEKINHCLITHCQKLHFDHLDKVGKQFLRKHQIPITCGKGDEAFLKRRKLFVQTTIKTWESINYIGGELAAIPAKHGYGWIHKMMANGVGYFLALPNEPTLYISGDTILTEQVRRALMEFQPDIAVMAAGAAQLDIGKPILMTMDDMVEFVELAPKKVIANHLEALNHCPTTRGQLQNALAQKGLLEKVIIPEDGAELKFD